MAEAEPSQETLLVFAYPRKDEMFDDPGLASGLGLRPPGGAFAGIPDSRLAEVISSAEW